MCNVFVISFAEQPNRCSYPTRGDSGPSECGPGLDYRSVPASSDLGAQDAENLELEGNSLTIWFRARVRRAAEDEQRIC